MVADRDQRGGPISGKHVVHSEVCREMKMPVTDAVAWKVTAYTWDAMSGEEHTRYAQRATAEKNLKKKHVAKPPPVRPPASLTLPVAGCPTVSTPPTCLSPVFKSDLALAPPGADGMETLSQSALAVPVGTATALEMKPSPTAPIIALSASQAVSVIEGKFNGSILKAAQWLDTTVKDSINGCTSFPDAVTYPRQCGSLCSRLALSEETWARWSMFKELHDRLNCEVTRLGGAVVAWGLKLLFAFEAHTLDGLRESCYVFMCGLYEQPEKTCLYLHVNSVVPLLVGDGHIVQTLTCAA